MAIAPWMNRPFYSFDIESTSADPLTAHLVTATLVKLENGAVSDKRAWTVKPAVEIPAEATDIHRITNEWINEHGKDPVPALEQILTMVAQVLNSGSALVVYNAAYDLTMLEAQANYYNLKPLTARVKNWTTLIDPFVLSKGAETFRTQEGGWGKGYKLPEVCARYNVPFVESHDATTDATGAALLAIRLMASFDFLAKATPQELTAFQKDWRTRLQDSLRKAFDKKGVEHDGVDAGWPLHSSMGVQ